jgi:hypothetical protein
MSAVKFLRFLLKSKSMPPEQLQELVRTIREAKLAVYRDPAMSADYLELVQTTEDYKVG